MRNKVCKKIIKGRKMQSFSIRRSSLPGTELETRPRSMFSGAGDAGSRRRWSFSSTPLSATTIFLGFCFVLSFIWVCIFRFTRGRSIRRTFHRRPAHRLLVSATVLPVIFSPWWIFSTATSRGGSLAIAAFGFSGSNPGDPLSGCLRTCLDVDSVRARQPFMEHRSQSKNSPFPSQGSCETSNPTKVAPFSISGASLQSISRLDPNLVGVSSPSSPSIEIPSPPTCSLFNGGTVHHRRNASGGTSCVRFMWIIGGSRSRRMIRRRRELRLFVVLLSVVLPLRLVLLPAMSREGSLTAALLWSSGLGSDLVVPPSDCRVSSQVVDLIQIFQLHTELRSQPPHFISPFPRRLEAHRTVCPAAPHLTDDRSITTASSVPSLCGEASIFGAWGQASHLESSLSSPELALPQSPSSSEEKPLPPYTLPMVRVASSDSLPSGCYSFPIVLLSCGAVSTGPEDTSEITLVVFVDGVWTPTSLVTILQLYDFIVKAFSTHSSIVLSSLSSSIEDLYYLAYLYVVVYAYCQRGWIIPSCYCNGEI